MTDLTQNDVGQLAGSIIAAAWATLPSFTLAGNRPRSDGPPLAPLLLSAVLLEAAGRMAANMHSSSSETLEHLSSNSKKAEPEGEAVLEHARRAQSVPMLSHANQQVLLPSIATEIILWTLLNMMSECRTNAVECRTNGVHMSCSVEVDACLDTHLFHGKRGGWSVHLGCLTDRT